MLLDLNQHLNQLLSVGSLLSAVRPNSAGSRCVAVGWTVGLLGYQTSFLLSYENIMNNQLL